MMKTHRRAALLLLLPLLWVPSTVRAQEATDTRPGIAVLPFAQGVSTGDDRQDLAALSIGLQQIMITELAQNPDLRVVDRAVLRDLMAEQDLGATGRVDGETAARIGRLVGARYVFTGGFNDIEGVFRLDGRVVDVETSEVIRAEQVTDQRERLYGIIVDVSNRVMNAVNLPPLTPAVRTERESRGTAIPREAVILYSQAQFFQDRGQTERAKELYRRITDEFPRLTEAREALRQIEQGGS
jgi:TolB-like protein